VRAEDRKLRRAGYRSFTEWHRRDRAVRRGEHAQMHDSMGVALFSEDQTVPRSEDAGYDEFDVDGSEDYYYWQDHD